MSGNAQPFDKLKFNYQFVYGEGIANYIQDIAGMDVSYLPSNSKPGKMKATPMMGWVLGASYQANEKWQFNVLGSQSRVWKTETYDNDYKYALYFGANAFYQISSFLQWGVECLWGYHASYGQGNGNNTRIQTQIKFPFQYLLK